MYKTEMENTYPVAEANGNRHALYCIPCKPNITCHHMGLRDKKKQQHCRTLYHKIMEKLVKTIPKKDSFFTITVSD